MRDRIRQLLAAFAGVGIAATGIGFAGAQADDADDASLAATQEVQLGSEEQIEEAESILERGQTICERVTGMKDTAQRGGDIILLDCLTPLSAQCTANLTSSNERIGFLREAVTARDAETANHQYGMLVLLEDNFDVLDGEANQCLGEEDFEVGDDRLTVQEPDDLPDEDPTTPAQEVPGSNVVPFIPPPASATM